MYDRLLLCQIMHIYLLSEREYRGLFEPAVATGGLASASALLLKDEYLMLN